METEFQGRNQAMSQREVERKYLKLINDVKTSDFYKVDLSNRINCYVCKTCKHVTKTKDIDAGVTPMFFTCENCGEQASSTFFKDIIPDQPYTFVWYRPTLEQCYKFRKDPALLDRVLSGGLSYRKV